MTNADFFGERWEYEQKSFRRVLEAVPGDRLDYRPHERSTSAGDLAWQLVTEQRGMAELLGTSETKYEPRPRPSMEEILAAWDAATEEVRAALASKDESKWEQPAKFYVGDDVAWNDSLKNMLWGFLFDMVHHRGQLSTYLRPMGGKVPAIYGPSADERG